MQRSIPKSLARPQKRLGVDGVTDSIFKEAHQNFEIIELTSNDDQPPNVPATEDAGEVADIHKDPLLQMIELRKRTSSAFYNEVLDVLKKN